MSQQTIICCDCVEHLDQCREQNKRFKLIFADPPDNIGLKYKDYKDSLPEASYYRWLESIILKAIPLTETFWLSYYFKHDLELTHLIRNILKYRHPVHSYRKLLWRYTFGQYNRNDIGSGFRYMVRISEPGTVYDTDSILIESERQRLGDKRAVDDGRVPDDIFDCPRVTGNSWERRSFHPTQHPAELMERIIKLCGPYTPESGVLDLFTGSGTTLIACKKLGITAVGCEIDPSYCEQIKEYL